MNEPAGQRLGPAADPGSDVTPTLSVIVPAYRCAPMLRRCLAGLAASTLPRAEWELVVVADGEDDATEAVAREVADRTVRIADGPRGPAFARNRGAADAAAPVLVFIDADVVVAPGTLAGFARHFAGDDPPASVFGAYDDEPADRGLVSQYRNLLHRYVHERDAGPAETFWAGCGAVRRDAFEAAGGFDATRFPRPQVEDIELGYRLHDAGGRILLDPTLTGTHLKRWTLWGMLRTDVRDRAVPWMRLLRARHARGVAGLLDAGPLNLAIGEKLCTGAAGLGLALAIAALTTGRPAAGWGAAALVVGILLGNASLFAWFARRRGIRFALLAMPLRVLFYVGSAVGGAWALATPARRMA